MIGDAILLPLPPGNEDLGDRLAVAPGLVGQRLRQRGHLACTGSAKTTKYFGTDLQLFRLRTADLDRAPESNQPPNLNDG